MSKNFSTKYVKACKNCKQKEEGTCLGMTVVENENPENCKAKIHKKS